MRRSDILDLAKQGRGTAKRINRQIYAHDIIELRELYSDKLFDVIDVAYHAGVASGYEGRLQEERREIQKRLQELKDMIAEEDSEA